MHDSDVHIQTAVGQFIRERRKLMGMNLEEFSDQIGIHSKTFNRIEMGYRLPTGSEIFTICRVLDITPNELLSAGGRIDIKDEDKSDEKEKRDEIADLVQTIYSFFRLSNRDKQVVSDFIRRLARSNFNGKNLDRYIQNEDLIRYSVVPSLLSWGDISVSGDIGNEPVFTKIIYGLVDSIRKGDSDETFKFLILAFDVIKKMDKNSYVKSFDRRLDVGMVDMALARGLDPEKVLDEFNAAKSEIERVEKGS